jgi:hypothetical protein
VSDGNYDLLQAAGQSVACVHGSFQFAPKKGKKGEGNKLLFVCCEQSTDAS